MTRAVFFIDSGSLVGFDVSGHTDNNGSDEARLVCAAVSSAVYMAVNTITDVVGCKADISAEDGHLKCMLSSDISRAQDMMRGLRMHLEGLEEQYSTFIEIIITEVQHDA